MHAYSISRDLTCLYTVYLQLWAAKVLACHMALAPWHAIRVYALHDLFLLSNLTVDPAIRSSATSHVFLFCDSDNPQHRSVTYVQ